METEKILIKNGHIIDPASKKNYVGSIYIENSKISAIAEGLDSWKNIMPKGETVKQIDAKGMVVSPGFIDTHSHFRDPGFTYKEDIFSGAEAAKAGGYTGIIMMANTKPAIDSVETLKQVLQKGKETGIDIMSAANITEDMEGKQPVDINTLKNEGAKVFTDDGKPITNTELIEEVMQKAADEDVILSFHEEDPEFVGTPGLNQGKASEIFGIEGAHRKAEYEMVKRDIELAKKYGTKILIQHISAKESVELVRQGKKNGVKVFAEAAPHHFSLTEDDLIEARETGRETLYKMNPPLREEEDRLAIIQGLKDGTIDLIATDHAPHSEEEKSRRPYGNAPSGITGLETALSLGIMNLVKPGYLSMERFIECMSTAAAKIYGIEGGSMEKGAKADLVIFDPEEKYLFKNHKSKGANSPWRDSELIGKVKYTIANGKVVYSDV